MRQKFPKFSFVQVDKTMPSSMMNFESDFDAIVDGTYSQIYGGDNITSYALFKVEDGNIVNRLSWYDEDQLTLLPEQDRDKAEQMLEEYMLTE